MARPGWLAMFAIAWAGCRETTPTQLVVVVQTDLSVPAEVDALSIRVGGKAVPGDPLPATDPGAFPASFGVRPRGGDASGRADIEVTALSNLAVVVTQRAITAFVEDERMRVDLYLSGSCRSVQCDEPGQTCWFGQCIDATVSREDLRPYRPGQPALDAGAALDAADPGRDASAPADAGPDASSDAGTLGALGEACSRFDLCEPGLLCSSWDLIAEIPDPGTCLLACLVPEDCQAIDPDALCIPTEGKLGFCTQPCDPRGSVGDCPEGTRCTILGFARGETATLCVAPGTGQLGDTCTAMTCAAPYHCVVAGGEEVCREACDVAGTKCPPETPRCALSSPVEDDGVSYGVCLPP